MSDIQQNPIQEIANWRIVFEKQAELEKRIAQLEHDAHQTKECECGCHKPDYFCGPCEPNHRPWEKPSLAPEQDNCRPEHAACYTCHKCKPCQKCTCKPSDAVEAKIAEISDEWAGIAPVGRIQPRHVLSAQLRELVSLAKGEKR